jgi:hypothetical protein
MKWNIVFAIAGLLGCLGISLSSLCQPLVERSSLNVISSPQEPSIDEFLSYYFQARKLDKSPGLDQLRRTRRAPWAPVLALGVDHSLRSTEALAINDNISVSSQGVNVGPADNNWDQTLNLGTTFRVRATWNLGNAIYNDDELAVLREAREMDRYRWQMSEVIAKLYERRTKLLGTYRQNKSPRMRAEIQELTSRLNQLSDHYFQERWQPEFL